MRHRRRPAGISIAFALTALLPTLPLTGCTRARPPESPPDIVLVVVDTLRADHLGVYGYPRPTSPAIDAFASQATVFENATSAAPWTLPSVMSIMTGRLPSSHRVENDGLRLAREIPTLAEVLAAGGYDTAGFVSHIYVDRPFGFERGFAAFEDFGLSRPGYRPEANLEPTADRVTDAALAWIARRGSRPFFLFVHYFDPHWPYAPPAATRDLFPNSYAGPWDATYDSISKFQDPERPLPDGYRQFLIDRYDGEIRFVDEQWRRLLEGLRRSGRAGRTWVVLTGDHGEEFKEHGSMGHGRQLYQEAIRVPLIVGRAAPGAASGGSRTNAPVSSIDLFPTLTQIAGLAGTPGVQGRSLGFTPGAAGLAEPADRAVISETARLGALRKAVRRGGLKLIRVMEENRVELYDLPSDPAERKDLSRERAAEARALLRDLFGEVDLLSGGWNLRWSGDGRPRRFQGEIKTSGAFRTVVPLFSERGKYRIDRGDTMIFDDGDQAGESGLAFTVAPDDASVRFKLLIDGRPRSERVFLGGRKALPPALPFELPGLAQQGAAFSRPPHAGGRDLGFYLWRLPPALPDQAIVLDDEIRERLRSLGYIDLDQDRADRRRR